MNGDAVGIVFEPPDGQQYQLTGKVDGAQDGQRVEVEGKVDKNAMGIGMMGAHLNVQKITTI